jgi:hypothetical protein
MRMVDCSAMRNGRWRYGSDPDTPTRMTATESGRMWTLARFSMYMTSVEIAAQEMGETREMTDGEAMGSCHSSVAAHVRQPSALF